MSARHQRHDEAAYAFAEASFPGSRGRRLRTLLADLGPVGAELGAYLATRPDLLPIADCRELAGMPVEVEPVPLPLVLGLIAEETGRARAVPLAALDDAPFRCGLATQLHRGRLRDGRPVLVEIARPHLGERLARDLVPLSPLAEASDLGAEVVADFRWALERRAALAERGAELESARAAAPRLSALRLPRVLQAAPRLLVTEAPAGRSLADALAEGLSEAERADAARRLWVAWLHQVLEGGSFPAELAGADLLLLPDGELGLAAAVLASLPAAAQAHFSEYLEGAWSEDAGRACTPLLALMEPPRPTLAAENELRQRLRQVVAFRDGAFGEAGPQTGLAEELFAQWRLAGARGLRPLPHLLDFYRGAVAVAEIAETLAPADRDPLAEAVATLRLLQVAERSARLTDPAALQRAVEGYATALADLPADLDLALRRVAEGVAGVRLEAEETEQVPRGASAGLVAALGLALAAIALLAQRLSATAVVGPWVEPAGAVAFLLLGGLLLRVLSRPG